MKRPIKTEYAIEVTISLDWPAGYVKSEDNDSMAEHLMDVLGAEECSHYNEPSITFSYTDSLENLPYWMARMRDRMIEEANKWLDAQVENS